MFIFFRTEGENSMDTEGEGEPLNPNEIELVFKPHPTEMTGDNQLMRALRDSSVRYLKTTANASGTDITKTRHVYFSFTYFLKNHKFGNEIILFRSKILLHLLN